VSPELLLLCLLNLFSVVLEISLEVIQDSFLIVNPKFRQNPSNVHIFALEWRKYYRVLGLVPPAHIFY
jgi:hypothetical protein